MMMSVVWARTPARAMLLAATRLAALLVLAIEDIQATAIHAQISTNVRLGLTIATPMQTAPIPWEALPASAILGGLATELCVMVSHLLQF